MKANLFKDCCRVILGFILMSPTLTIGQESAVEDAFSAALSNLKAGTMQERGQAIEQLAAVQKPQAIAVLQALLDGRLFTLKADEKLVIGEEVEAGYTLIDAHSAESPGTMDRAATQKITVNNSLRSSLRQIIGRLQLNDEKPGVRLAAVGAMSKSVNEQSLALLRDHLSLEQDENVQKAIKLILGLGQLNSADKTLRLAAITVSALVNSSRELKL